MFASRKELLVPASAVCKPCKTARNLLGQQQLLADNTSASSASINAKSQAQTTNKMHRIFTLALTPLVFWMLSFCSAVFSATANPQ